MKISAALIILIMLVASCHNAGTSGKAADTTNINTNTGSMPEGGPNHGMPDTNGYNRANDTIVHDTNSKK